MTRPKQPSRTPARKSPQPKPLPLKLVVGGAYVHGPSYGAGIAADLRTLVLLTPKPDAGGKLRFASVLSPKGGVAFPKLSAKGFAQAGWRLTSMPDGTKVTAPKANQSARKRTKSVKAKPADVGPDSAS